MNAHPRMVQNVLQAWGAPLRGLPSRTPATRGNSRTYEPVRDQFEEACCGSLACLTSHLKSAQQTCACQGGGGGSGWTGEEVGVSRCKPLPLGRMGARACRSAEGPRSNLLGQDMMQ